MVRRRGKFGGQLGCVRGRDGSKDYSGLRTKEALCEFLVYSVQTSKPSQH